MRYFSFNGKNLNYNAQAIAQRYFAQELARKIAGEKFHCIAELGCGSGILFDYLIEHNVRFEDYEACDCSQEMLDQFLQKDIKKTCLDFDSFLSNSVRDFSLICSSSALQWSKNLEKTLLLVAKKSQKVAFSIITSNTFASMHSFLKTTSPLIKSNILAEMVLDLFEGEMHTACINLDFKTPKEIIAHLRGSGVMGGGVLGFSQSRKLLTYSGVLEYESMIFVGQPK